MTVTLSKRALKGAPSPGVFAAPMVGTFAAGAPVCFSDPGVVDLCIYRGDTGAIRVTVTGIDVDGEPVPYDVTGASWDCDLRATADSATVLASLEVVPVEGMSNAVDLVLDAATSAAINDNCVWDLEMTMGTVVVTLLRGKVTVTKDVSR